MNEQEGKERLDKVEDEPWIMVEILMYHMEEMVENVCLPNVPVPL